jgi:hypothetical protein
MRSGRLLFLAGIRPSSGVPAYPYPSAAGHQPIATPGHILKWRSLTQRLHLLAFAGIDTVYLEAEINELFCQNPLDSDSRLAPADREGPTQ